MARPKAWPEAQAAATSQKRIAAKHIAAKHIAAKHSVAKLRACFTIFPP